jgi:hypothetical protein
MHQKRPRQSTGGESRWSCSWEISTFSTIAIAFGLQSLPEISRKRRVSTLMKREFTVADVPSLNGTPRGCYSGLWSKNEPTFPEPFLRIERFGGVLFFRMGIRDRGTGWKALSYRKN